MSLLPTQAALQLLTLRFDQADVIDSKEDSARSIADRMVKNKARYQNVDLLTNVPWYVIGAIHNMESGGAFDRHLHEGSPLTGRTKFEPKGRPVVGKPPFTWEESAVDALKYDRLDKVDWMSLSQTLFAIERYNGLGYQQYHPETPSPYLWAATTIEKPGKYIEDGRWSATARSKQIGVVAIFKTLEGMGILDFSKLKG